jgi:hypothetical protein
MRTSAGHLGDADSQATQSSPAPDPEPSAVSPVPVPLPSKRAVEPSPKAASDRASWYKAAGQRPPREGPFNEEDVAVTAANLAGGYGAAGTVLIASAVADGVGAALGVSHIGYFGAALELVAALVLWSGVRAGRLLGWIATVWCIVWAGVLVLHFRMPLAAALKILPAICLGGVLIVETRGARSALAGIGAAVALVGLVVPLTLTLRSAEPAEEVTAPLASPGSYVDAKLGFSLKAPDGVRLSTSRKEAKEWLPGALADSASPKVVFATADKSFSGGVAYGFQPAGTDLSNLLGLLGAGGNPPVRNLKLVPDTLGEVEAQGWEVETAAGFITVVLARAPDGRAFALFGVSAPVAKVRAMQLFTSIAWGFQVKKSLGDP